MPEETTYDYDQLMQDFVSSVQYQDADGKEVTEIYQPTPEEIAEDE